MPENILVVRGVVSTDDLMQLGLPMAQRFASADTVLLVGKSNIGFRVKDSAANPDSTVVEFFDADPVVGRCQRAVNKVKQAYDETDEPVVGWTAEMAVGMFLYYWPLHQESVEVVADGIERGDFENVEAAADLFIRCGFGTDLSKL